MDGEVSLDSLEGRSGGRVLDYVVDPEVQYLVAGVGTTTGGAEGP